MHECLRKSMQNLFFLIKGVASIHLKPVRRVGLGETSIRFALNVHTFWVKRMDVNEDYIVTYIVTKEQSFCFIRITSENNSLIFV